MHRCSIFGLSRIFLSTLLLGSIVSGGCVNDRQVISPYQTPPAYQTIDRTPVRRPVEEQPLPLESTQGSTVQLAADDDILLPVLTHINERIYAYEQKQIALNRLREKAMLMNVEEERVNAIDDCIGQVRGILERYNSWHRDLLGSNTLSSRTLLGGDMLLQLDKLDFGYLEGQCSMLPSGEGSEAGALVPGGEEITEAQMKEIHTAYDASRYEEAIELYERLTARSGRELPYDLVFTYGQALMKTGREERARDVFKDLLVRIRGNDQALWEFKLMQVIGDLEFALRSYPSASKQYSEIIQIYDELQEKNNWARQQLSALNVADEQQEEVRAYADVLRAFLAYNPDRDGFTVVRKAEEFVNKYPYSLVASSADQLVEISKKLAEQWYGDLLKKVEKLAAEEKFQEALLTIERVPRTILPIEKQQELAEKSAELSSTEAIVRESKELAEEQAIQENWNEGMSFLEYKEYDKAIESFSKLLGTSYAERARKKIDEAAELAAREDRRRAAELFVRSNRTHDPESRKKLLLSSRQLLQDILIKYPQSELVDKVKRNLNRIEEQIRAIDPSLLSAPVTVNGELQESKPVSVDSMFEQPAAVQQEY